MYPLGELPGPFQSRDVLGRVQNELLELALGKYPHLDGPMKGASRCPGYDKPRGSVRLPVKHGLRESPPVASS